MAVLKADSKCRMRTPRFGDPSPTAELPRPGSSPWLLALLAVLAMASCATAHGISALSAGSERGAAKAPAASYRDLVARAEAGDMTVDFRALRLAFLHSPERRLAQQRHTEIGKLRRKLQEVLTARGAAQAVTVAREILALNYIDILAHEYLSQACRALDDRPCAQIQHG
jgi:hypothetical protein